MKIGIPKEILDKEYRVSITPDGVACLTAANHELFIQSHAGEGSGFSNESYVKAGAKILHTAEDVFRMSTLILKVKQPLFAECKLLEPHHILFTYLHLAANKKLAELLCESKALCIAYETVEAIDGSLPLLKPMSEIAGRMSVQIGARHLESEFGGRGVLLGGVSGVSPGQVLIIGGGVVGMNAAIIAHGMKAHVTILDRNEERLKFLSNYFNGEVNTLKSTDQVLTKCLKNSDLVITAALIAGAQAPVVITKDLISLMKLDSVIVDVAIDQGGCVEAITPTSHSEPIKRFGKVNVYAVPNIPGAVPRTSTQALTNVTLPYVHKLASNMEGAFTDDRGFSLGINVRNGNIVHETVASALGMKRVKF